MNDFLIGIVQQIIAGLLLAAVLFLIKRIVDYLKKNYSNKNIKPKHSGTVKQFLFYTQNRRIRGESDGINR